MTNAIDVILANQSTHQAQGTKPEAPAPAPETQAEPTTDPAPVAAVPEKKEEEQFSSRFAALARKEKQALQRAQEVKAKEEALMAKEKALQERMAWLEKMESNPLEAIKEKGWTYEDITNAVLSGQKDLTPEMRVKKLEAEVQARFKAQEEARQREIEEQKKIYEAQQAKAMEEFRAQTAAFIDANAEKYELTKIFGQHDLVVQTIEEHYRKTSEAGTPKILSQEEAADLVEKYLEGEVEKAKKAKKFSQPKAEAMPKDQIEKELADPSPKTARTIADAAPSMSTINTGPARTEQERMQRALAILNSGRA